MADQETEIEKEIADESDFHADPARQGPRRPYLCSQCRQPKKGHNCKAPARQRQNYDTLLALNAAQSIILNSQALKMLQK
jgi:hypothetical protein